MIKANLRWFFFSAVVILSISSFIFINTVDSDIISSENMPLIEEVQGEKEQQSVNLPDLEVVKSLIENTKKIIHLF